MRKLFLSLLIIGLFFPLWGHDIGVSKAELNEKEGNAYELRVQTGASGVSLFSTPTLPEICTFSENPRGTFAGGWKRFIFSCSEGLKANDTLFLPWRRDGIMLYTTWRDGTEVKHLFRNEAGMVKVELSELQAGSGSTFQAAKRYTELGVEHILMGYDHLLFVLALLLIVSNTWTLIKTITAFTLAHSITLGLATLGFINMPTRPVEAAIALSIAYLCVEIVYAKRGKKSFTHSYPWVVAFIFGLLHGLGFAGALSEIGLPASEIPLALLFFNVGVEIGQLIFVLFILILIKLMQKKWQLLPSAFRMVPVYLIGTIASYWFLERLGAILPL